MGLKIKMLHFMNWNRDNTFILTQVLIFGYLCA